MCPLDERILETLKEESWSSPAMLATQFDFTASSGRIRERCKLLARVGFVDFPLDDTDFVEITTRGKLYLDGEVNAENLPDPRAA
ncbi:MAG: hypothetical protein ACI8XM_000223 [Haloarculaceae archaeon]|jgi:hypothetical protein